MKRFKDTRGYRNHNPGNIRLGCKWQGLRKFQQDSSFCLFEDFTYGLRALAILLNNYIAKGYNSNKKIISRYAPSIENNTKAYIQSVNRYTSRDSDEIYNSPTCQADKVALAKLMSAICCVENGDPSNFDFWYHYSLVAIDLYLT